MTTNMYVKPATEVPIEDIAECATSAFKGYIAGDIEFDPATLPAMLEENFISQERSLILFEEGNDKPVAFGFIASRKDRPTLSRVMGFGVIPSHAGKGHGKTLMRFVIDSERKHGIKTLELECIKQNPAGIKLYSGLGFTAFKELPSYQGSSELFASSAEGTAPADLQEANAADVRALMQKYVDIDVAWQAFNPPISDPTTQAYTLGHAHCIIGNPTEEGKKARLRCLFVEPEYRGKGEAIRLARAVAAKINKEFETSAWFPKETVEPLATKLNMTLGPIGQYQMRLDI